MLNNYGLIYLGLGTNPETDRVVIKRSGFRTTIVPVPEESAAVQVAVELVDEGAQLIELCGIFGPVWAAKVIEATGGRVPIGSVAYGVESVPGLAALSAPDA